MLNLKSITFFWCISFCCGIQQQLVIYSTPDCFGKGIIFDSKEPDVTSFSDIFLASQSFSTIGSWGFYNNTNYIPWDTYPLLGGLDARYCFQNDTRARPAKSVRYFGPPDTTTDSISLYEDLCFSGREVTITGSAFANIPFAPQSLVTTGQTSWTLYSGSDFDGTSTCYIPGANFWAGWSCSLNSTMSNVRSIYRGCNRHIDHYIYGGNDA